MWIRCGSSDRGDRIGAGEVHAFDDGVGCDDMRARIEQRGIIHKPARARHFRMRCEQIADDFEFVG